MRLLLILLLLPITVWAQTDGPAPIHRCVGASGQIIFTDRMCADMQATPTLPAPTEVPGAPPPPILCAGNLDELKQAVVDAFAARDANRLTGLMLWNGYGKTTVISTTRLLSLLMERGLLDLESSSAQPAATGDAHVDGGSVAPSIPATVPAALILRTTGNDGSGTAHETRLGMTRRSGCLWLRPPG